METHIWVGDGVLSLDRVGLETERHRQLGKRPAMLCPPVALPRGRGLSRDCDFLGTDPRPHGQSFLPERIPASPQQPRALGGVERGGLGAEPHWRPQGWPGLPPDAGARGATAQARTATGWAVSREGEKGPRSPGFLKENPSKGWNPVRDELLSF